jgi:hypothetical protein
MFVTSSSFVQHLHPSSVLPPQSHWRVLTLTLERHWYLLVFKVVNQGRLVTQTALVAWDETLVDLLAEIPKERLMGIARLDWQADHSGPWALRWMDDLWSSSPSEAGTVGPLVFRLGADAQTRDIQLRPVGECADRRRLYEKGETGRSQEMRGVLGQAANSTGVFE